MNNIKKAGIILITLGILITCLIFKRKTYDIRTCYYDDKVVIMLKNNTNDSRDYSIKGTKMKIHYLLPNQTSAFVIERKEYKKIKKINIISNINIKYKSFSNYDVNEEKNISKKEVNIELIKNNPKQEEVYGELMMVFSQNKSIIDIEMKKIKFDSNVYITYKENSSFDDVKIIYRFWKK